MIREINKEMRRQTRNQIWRQTQAERDREIRDEDTQGLRNLILARASISPARIHSDNRILLRQSFYCFNIRKTPNPENGAAYIARSVTFQHLMWRDST